MSADIEWADPPPSAPQRKVDQVASALRSRPGQWAKIDHRDGLSFRPWWAPLASDDRFEMRYVGTTTSGPFGPRDIYCRYIADGDPPMTEDEADA